MAKTKGLSNLTEASPGGRHTARRPALEVLVAPAAEAAASHAAARKVALGSRKAAAQRTNGDGLDSARPAAPTVKGPIRCHNCQLVCTDAEHYLSHQCEPRPVISPERLASKDSAWHC